jgi:uncharacterized membrane protein HdeD (DUF308 family)
MTELYSPEALRAEEAREPVPNARYWYLLLLSGLIGIGVGVAVLVHPSRSLNTLAVILGVYLLALGVLVIVRTASDEDRGAGGLLLGILTLIAGVVVIRHPGQSIVVVSLALGLYFVVAGALNIAQAIIGPQRLLHLVRGIVLLAAGIVITSSTDISVKTLALLTGIALCVEGVIQIGEAFVLRSLYRSGQP